MLQDLILTAVNDAMKNADDMSQNELGRFTRGMNLPF
jgi:DNA-binding protein YbaB